ncbi:hypothetical protein BDP27DRAFT_1327092 [Rhodocollybia butyracea]|uniref:Sm domain-containing protein n=1 Tax=Rhodocollybia butyracea TaxID=206335 RepID=A0A9P5PM96_9AGAR|nr:hypothetical protein BDP27DRAFT_1327092 [Rhodocollybia butyracea]
MTSPSSAVEKLRQLLASTLRISVSDGRIFLGSFIGTDQLMNILLTDTEEFRTTTTDAAEDDENQTNTAGRFIGQVLVPWKIIRKIEVQESGQSARTRAAYGPMDYT